MRKGLKLTCMHLRLDRTIHNLQLYMINTGVATRYAFFSGDILATSHKQGSGSLCSLATLILVRIVIRSTQQYAAYKCFYSTRLDLQRCSSLPSSASSPNVRISRTLIATTSSDPPLPLAVFLNAMLAMLNARQSLRSRMGEDMGLRLPLRFVSSSRVEVPRELTLAHEEVPPSRSSPARDGL